MVNNRQIKKLIEYPESGIISKEIFKTRTFDTTLFCMAKGTNISDHTSASEAYIQVLEGRGVFKLQKKNIKMEPGVVIYMKSHTVHALKAYDNTTFLLLLIKK